MGSNDGEPSEKEAQVVAVVREDTVALDERDAVSEPLPDGSILNPHAEGLRSGKEMAITRARLWLLSRF